MIYPWQQASWKTLQQARSNKRLGHALLLSGPAHCGKLDFARLMAASLLCEAPDSEFQACGECKPCHLFSANSHPDFIEVLPPEKKKQIVVDQIREINEFTGLSRSMGGNRVIIISPMEWLNQNASNSLLKTLEEPTPHTVLLMVSSSLSRLLPTIKSRCQIIQMPAPTAEQSREWLSGRIVDDNEDIQIMAANRPLLATALAESEMPKERRDFAVDLLKLLRGQLSMVAMSKSWEKYDREALLDWQLQWAQQMIRHSAAAEELDRFCAHFYPLLNQHSTALFELYQALIRLKEDVHTSLNALLMVQSMLMLWVQTIPPKQ